MACIGAEQEASFGLNDCMSPRTWKQLCEGKWKAHQSWCPLGLIDLTSVVVRAAAFLDSVRRSMTRDVARSAWRLAVSFSLLSIHMFGLVQL